MKRPIILILLAILCSCRTQLPVVEHVKTDIQVSLQYDSISRDHYRYMWIAGDTVHVTDSVFIDRWRVKTDSIVRIDSIPYPVEVPVPGSMTGPQTFLYKSGIALWIVLSLAVVGALLYLFVKLYFRR